MFGLRYHVVTLCAMFIMLAIGIVIGTTSGLGPAVVRQQTATLRSLNQRLNNVLNESDRDHTLLRQNEDALSAVAPALIAGTLKGKRVAIVRTGDYSDAADAAAAAIAAAGGTVTSTTVITDRLQLLGAARRHSVAQDIGVTLTGDIGRDVAALLHPVAAILHAGSDARPDLETSVSALAADGIIDTSGDYSLPVTDVVVVGGSISDDGLSDSGSDGLIADAQIEQAIISNLTEYGPGPSAMTVVGCEPLDAGTSSEPTYAQAGISSVDCIDSPVGEIDLPYALVGPAGTAYGMKTTATELVPAALQADNTPNETGEQ